MTRILIADDHALLRRGFRMVLESEPDLEVVGEAADGHVALRQVASLAPDVVLMDVRMPGGDGIEATRAIVAEHPATRVLVLTTFDLDEYAFGALEAGASGFLLKNAEPADLVRAVRAVAAGDAVVEPRVTQLLLGLVAAGMTNGEIAAELHLSTTTVKTHVGNLLAKLGLRDRVQLVILAYESGLVPRR